MDQLSDWLFDDPRAFFIAFYSWRFNSSGRRGRRTSASRKKKSKIGRGTFLAVVVTAPWMNQPRGRGGIGRRNGLKRNLSARRETGDAELLKFGEPCNMAIPSQALPEKSTLRPGRCRD